MSLSKPIRESKSLLRHTHQHHLPLPVIIPFSDFFNPQTKSSELPKLFVDRSLTSSQERQYLELKECSSVLPSFNARSSSYDSKKTKFILRSLINKYCTAMLSGGGGYLVFGVDDYGKIKGLPDEEYVFLVLFLLFTH
jgi:hypothetical protein